MEIKELNYSSGDNISMDDYTIIVDNIWRKIYIKGKMKGPIPHSNASLIQHLLHSLDKS